MHARQIAAETELDGDRELETIAAYETLIASGEASLDDYVNLSAIYFQFNGGFPRLWEEDGDDGYPDPVAQLNRAVDTWQRALAILDAAEQRFGARPAILFWRHYISYMRIDDHLPTEEECLSWAASDETREPYVFRYGFLRHTIGIERASTYEHDAHLLYAECSAEATHRQRYLFNVLWNIFSAYGINPDTSS